MQVSIDIYAFVFIYFIYNICTWSQKLFFSLFSAFIWDIF